jgi:hypothetical protein
MSEGYKLRNGASRHANEACPGDGGLADSPHGGPARLFCYYSGFLVNSPLATKSSSLSIMQFASGISMT